MNTVKPVLSIHSKRTPKIGFQYRLLLNAGQKYCRMLQGEHSAILSTFIKLPFSIKTFVLSICKLPLKTGFTVFLSLKVVIILENSADPDEMQLYVSFYLGLHCLSKYPFRGFPPIQRVKWHVEM